MDVFGPDLIQGWAQAADDPRAKPVLEIWEDGALIGVVVSEHWRKDLEETRQGDGRWGVRAAVPVALRDGRVHRLRLTLAGGADLLPGPFAVQFSGDGGAIVVSSDETDEERPSVRSRPERVDAPDDVVFSVVVNFYNMRREAERTLTSLSRAYQRGIGRLRYEVLCIDNFSDPPLQADWVAGFGPQFRLVVPSMRQASPCAAINEAVGQAAGRYVAIMIDGAHVLTPGVLREAWDTLSEAPGAVVAVRQWFVGGDQRWLARVGYTRAQEDVLFDKIAWPEDGYRLFRVGAPVWESPNHWFDGLIESNCLFMPKALFHEIGGMDVDFSEPGAGYANLDLFKRAAEASPEPVVALIGEASFHQFHDGTTTNVDTAVKESRVRGYENKYVALRGKPYGGVEPVDIRVRGQIRTLQAVMARQRPLSPARIGVTDRIRPGVSAVHFDEHAQQYLQSAYVELGLHEQARWMGERLGVAPSDAMTIQELIFRLRPSRIVAVNAAPGLLMFVDDVVRSSQLAGSVLVGVGADLDVSPAGMRKIQGAARDSAVLDAVARALDADGPTLVLFSPDEDDAFPLEALRAYASFVTCRSYLVFLGTALGQPWLGYSTRWYLTAIRMMLASAPFVMDVTCNPHMTTSSPCGYLQRIEEAGAL